MKFRPEGYHEYNRPFRPHIKKERRGHERRHRHEDIPNEGLKIQRNIIHHLIIFQAPKSVLKDPLGIEYFI